MPVTNDGPIISPPKPPLLPPKDDGPAISPPPPKPPPPPPPPPLTDEEYSVSNGNCLTLKDGIAVSNECKLSGDEIKCPAASAINYKGESITMDVHIFCAFDSVQQSDWVTAS